MSQHWLIKSWEPSMASDRRIWAVVGFLLGMAVAGGSLTIGDLVLVSELVPEDCPQPEPEPAPQPPAEGPQ